jgi:hypothetical protein
VRCKVWSVQAWFFCDGFDSFLEVRGTVVEITEAGALEHLDGLCELYIGKSPYFGGRVPAEFKEKEIPVVCKMLLTHVVTLDATRKEVEQLGSHHFFLHNGDKCEGAEMVNLTIVMLLRYARVTLHK